MSSVIGPDPYLGASRPDSGALPDAWGHLGDESINNARTKLSAGIKGITSIDLTGLTARTLQTADNALDEAAAAGLRFFGTPTGPVTVTMPTRQFWYLVENETAQPLTFVSGGASFVVPASSWAQISSRGTDVKNAAASLDMANAPNNPVPFNGQRATGLGAATENTDAPTFGQMTAADDQVKVDVAADADRAEEAADAAVAAASAAAADLTGTSTTNHVIGGGQKTWTTQAGKAWAKGMLVQIVDDANPSTNVIQGVVNNYAGTDLTVDITNFLGSGSISAWTITTLSATAFIQDTEDSVTVLDGALAVQTYTITPAIPSPRNYFQVSAVVTQGTATAQLAVGGALVPGTLINVTTTLQTVALGTVVVVDIGESVEVVVTAAATSGTFQYTAN